MVSLLVDVVYEGARSVTGPLLASLGASALVVGVVAGAGEAAALGLRLVAGPWLPAAFRRFAAFTAATTAGFAMFALLAYHLVERDLLPVAGIPVLYAAAMFVDALAALATGWLYDRVGPRVLAALPVVAAVVPMFAFTASLPLAAAGSLVCGAAMGVQESTLRARSPTWFRPPAARPRTECSPGWSVP